MKKWIVHFCFAASLSLSFSHPVSGFAQSVPPPPPDHGQTGNQAGGSAPLGPALPFTLLLFGVYGAKKVYEFQRNAND
ncbi:MAG TPA: hypothetical protein PLV51_06215 [Lentimicrobium sp.]|jgi:hypothetical protein|nr:hypothetical protein [Lentimicrobium sp.]